MTPEQEAQDRLRRAIVDDEFPDAEQVEQSPFAAVIPDPLAFERNAAVSAWMSQASGRNVDAGTPTWQAEKDALAQGFFKMPTAKGVTDNEIHGLIRQHVMMAEEAVMDGINAALAGRPLLESVSAFEAKGGASKLRAKWPEYSQEMRKYYDATEARVAPYRELITSSSAQLGREMESGLPTTDAFKAVADQLLEIPEADRRIVIKAMAATGGDTPDAQRSYLGKLGAAFGRMSEGLGASVESGVSDLIYSMAASGGIEQVNPEAAGALRQQGQTTRSYYQLANMVRKVADSDISPIEAEGFLAETGIGLARMGPLLASSAVPYAGVATMASFYRDDVAANLMLEYEGLDAAKADQIALVAAPGIAALEHASNLLPFGKLPGVGSFLKSSITSIKAGIIRGGTLVAAGTGGEIAEEVFQEIAPKLVQDLFAQVDKEVPGVNWTDEKKKLEKIPAQVFGPALAVSLIGGGVVSVNDVKHGRAISSDRDTLIASGYAPSMADDIALKSKEGDWAGVDTLMRSAYDRKKGGISGATEQERKAAVEAIQAKVLLQQSAIETLRNNGDLARMANVGGKWVVTRPDGSAPVSFDNPDDADALVWQDAKDRKLRIHAVYRDIISQANRALQEGQENAFIFSPEKMTPEAAVEAGLVSAQAVEGRKKQLAALDEGRLEDQDFTRAEKEAQAEGDTDAVYTILGMNNIENREGVSRGVIRLFQGANFTDLIEEIAEVGFKRHFGSKEANRPAMLASLRQAEGAIQRAEQAAGMEPTLLFRTKDDAQISDSDLIEAFSHLAKSYYINAVEQGGTSADWRTKNKSVPRYLRTLRAAIANTEIFKWVKAMGEKLGTIYKRAAMVQEAQKAGGLDAGLEQLIRRSVGLDTQDQMEAGILQEAQGIVQEAGMSMAGSRAQPTESAPSFVMPDGSTIVGPTTFSIRAYHGTPHKVDRFSTDKIGTGEGAQVYGWGLYFAENKNTAVYYREQLSRRAGAYVDGQPAKQYGQIIWEAADDIAALSGDIDAYIKQQKLRRGVAIQSATEAGNLKRADLLKEILDEELNAAEWLRAKKITRDGNLYTVDILPNEDDFLDWDKPLSEQSEKVKAAIRDSLGNREFSTMMDKPGMDVLGTLKLRGNSDMQVSAILAAAGIPGIKYLDGNSRNSGIGTSNYVIFDESLVKILEENGQPVEGGMEAVSMSLSKGDQSLEQRLAAMFDPFQKNPEQRRKLGLIAKERVAKVAREYLEETAKPGMVKRKLDEMEADRQKKLSKVTDKTPDWVKAQLEKPVTEAQAKAEISQDRLLGWLRALNAAASVLPVEIRGKLLAGGSIKIASLKTNEARLRAIETLIERADTMLEKWLRKEFTTSIEKLFDRYRPTREAGQKPKGKLAPDEQILMDAAEAAMALDPVALQAEIAKAEAVASNPDATDEQQVEAERLRDLLQLTGDWKNADAERMSAAYDAVRNVAEKGWAKWKLAELMKRAERQEMRDSLVKDTGKTGVRGERVAMRKQGETIAGKSLKVLLNLSSFQEIMDFAFGKDSKISKYFQDKERAADNQREDAMQDLDDRVSQFFTTQAGGILKGEQLRFNMGQRTIATTEEAGEFSQLEAITAILMWQQEDGKRHMMGRMDESGKPSGKWHYDQAFVDTLNAGLDENGRALLSFLRNEYDAEYESLNALYKERHGVSLPKHQFYSPIVVAPQQAKAGEVVDPLTGSSTTSSILTPGFLRSRSFNAVAEPNFRDALQVFIAHKKMLAHWAAYYDLAVEMQSIINNREVQNAVSAKAGEQASLALRRYLDVFAQGGIRDAAAGLETVELQKRMIGRASQVALFGRLSVLLVQSTQLAAASVKMPTGAYLVRLSKLMSGNLAWGDAINSPYIQRRMKVMTPLLRQAMADLATIGKPNQIKHAAQKVGQLINGADGLFTAGTYAILLDWHKAQARKLGMTDEVEINAFANQNAERDTETVAQPTRSSTRSLAELTATHPLTRAIYSFVSEPRQKLAMLAWAAYQGANRTGAKSAAGKALSLATDPQAAKVAFLTFIVGGLGVQVIKNLWRDAKGDDDEKKWSVQRMTLAMLSSPLSSVPGFAAFTDTGGNLFSSGKRLVPALEDLVTEDQDAVQIMQDVDTVLSVAGLFSDNAAAMSAMTHIAVDAAKVLKNLQDEED